MILYGIILCAGLFYAPTPHWKSIRTAVLHGLREEGMGKSPVESKILCEVNEYINYWIKPLNGRPMNPAHSMTLATGNYRLFLLFGSEAISQCRHVQALERPCGRVV